VSSPGGSLAVIPGCLPRGDESMGTGQAAPRRVAWLWRGLGSRVRGHRERLAGWPPCHLHTVSIASPHVAVGLAGWRGLWRSPGGAGRCERDGVIVASGAPSARVRRGGDGLSGPRRFQAVPRRASRAAPGGGSRLYSWPWRAAAQARHNGSERRPCLRVSRCQQVGVMQTAPCLARRQGGQRGKCWPGLARSADR
jgi:hypothetical protein